MADKNLIGYWVTRFLQEYSDNERGCAWNTRLSYCDAFRLLFTFVSKKTDKPVDRLFVEDISSDMVRNFLTHLEHDRKCCAKTRNLRLKAIRALSRFISQNSPEHASWSNDIHNIATKNEGRSEVIYLELSGMEALLNIVDPKNWTTC